MPLRSGKERAGASTGRLPLRSSEPTPPIASTSMSSIAMSNQTTGDDSATSVAPTSGDWTGSDNPWAMLQLAAEAHRNAEAGSV